MRVGTVAFRAVPSTILPSSSNSELLDFARLMACSITTGVALEKSSAAMIFSWVYSVRIVFHHSESARVSLRYLALFPLRIAIEGFDRPCGIEVNDGVELVGQTLSK